MLNSDVTAKEQHREGRDEGGVSKKHFRVLDLKVTPDNKHLRQQKKMLNCKSTYQNADQTNKELIRKYTWTMTLKEQERNPSATFFVS